MSQNTQMLFILTCISRFIQWPIIFLFVCWSTELSLNFYFKLLVNKYINGHYSWNLSDLIKNISKRTAE